MIVTSCRRIRRTSPGGRLHIRSSFSRTWRRVGATVLLAFAPLVLSSSAVYAAPRPYTGPNNGDWDTGTNWTGGVKPGTTDDATNSTATTVVHSQNIIDTVNSVSFSGAGSLTLSGGTLAGTQANQGSAFSVAGIFLLSGGTLSNFAIANSNSLTFANNSSNTLQNVALDAGLTIGNASTAGYASIAGTMTHGAGATFSVGYNSTLNFTSNYTLDNASLNFTGSGYYGFVGNAAGTTLTLGTGLTATGPQGYFNGAGTLTNNGSLISSQGNSWFVSPATLNGTGTLGVSGTGSTMTVNPTNYTGLGNLTASGTGSVVHLQGGSGTALATADITSASTSAGGLIYLETTLVNTSATLAAPITAALTLNSGTINGGTIANSNSLGFSNSGSNTLQNVTLGGTSGLTLGDQVGTSSSGNVNIAGTLTNGTGANYNIGYNSTLNFTGNTTLNNANLNFTASGYYGFVTNNTGTTLTLGSGVTATGRAGQFNGSGALINQGTLNSNGSGTWYVDPAQGVTNSGTIKATGTNSNLYLNVAGLVNTGSLQALTNGTVHLVNGTVTTGNLGSLSASGGGTISLEATVTNTGAIIDPQSFGNFLVNGGTIVGGTIANANSLGFSNSGGNTLQNVTLGGTSGLTLGDQVGTSSSGYTNITGTLTNGAGAAYNIGYNSTLNFTGNTTLNNANLNFTASSYYGFVTNAANTTLTLGSGVTATGRAGQFDGSGALINQGTINSNGGGTWYVDPAQGVTNSGTIEATGTNSSLNLYLAGLTNTGTIKALTNGIVHLTNGTVTTGNLGSLSATGGGTISLEATVTNTGATLDAQAIGNFLVNGGTINGGTIANSNSLGFSNNSSNTLQNVTLGGTSGLTLGDQVGTSSSGFSNITGTLTNGSSAAYNLGYNSTLNFTSNTTLNNANLNFTASSYYGFVTNNAGTTLTLGSGVTATGRAGQFDGSGALVNQGTINSNGGGQWYVDPTQGVTNSGTIEATGTNSVLTLYLAGLVNTGTIKALNNGSVHLTNGTVTTGNLGSLSATGGGAIDLEATVTNTGATLDPQSFGNFLVNGGTINGGTIANSNSLGFSNNGSNTLQNVALNAGLTLGDQVGTSSSGNVNIAGTLTNGTGANYNLGYNSTLNFTGNTTLNNANINFTASSYYGFVTNAVNTTLTLGSGVTATGRAGQFTGSGALVNQGTLNSNGGSGWFITPSQGFTNSGTAEATGANSALTISTTTFTNSGTLQTTGGGSITLTSTGATPVAPVNTGAVIVSSGSTLTVSNDLTQTASGSTRLGGPLTQVDGTMTLNGSTSATNTLTLAGGVLDGIGTVKGNVVNTGGSVSPGDSPGTLTIATNGNSGTGSYTQGAGGTFTEELGGTGAGQFDVLSVAGTATLDGTLSVSAVNGFTPTVGQTFAFMSYNNPSGNEGAFASVISQNQGYAYNVTYSNLGAVLHVTAVPAPEPSQWVAFGLGCLGLSGLALRARHRSNQAA